MVLFKATKRLKTTTAESSIYTTNKWYDIIKQLISQRLIRQRLKYNWAILLPRYPLNIK